MIPLLTVEDVRRAEENAIAAGTSESELMRKAGQGIANAIRRTVLDQAGTALVLCGPGKNGGDGMVIADELRHAGWNVSIWCHSRDDAGTAPVSNGFSSAVTWLADRSALMESTLACDIVVDAVFGVGSRPELPDDVTSAFDTIREARHGKPFTIWAVDVPSGLNVDTAEIAGGALHADVTAMIGLPKRGPYRLPGAAYAGQIELIDIGLTAPESVHEGAPKLITIKDVRRVMPARYPGLHKRAAGTALVVGGAPDYYGAPRLSAEAALRSGTGLVTVAAPSALIPSIASAVPELTFVALPMAEHGMAGDRMASMVREKLDRMDALVIGPGMGTDAPVPDFLSRLFGLRTGARRAIGFGSYSESEADETFSGKAVIDADALNWLATQDGWEEGLRESELILTPHVGELARLLGVEKDDILQDPWERARQAAQQFGHVVVLKYAHTVVATPDGSVFVAPQGPPSLATAGTGDVLTGIIGGLLGQGLAPLDAAYCGIYIGLEATALAEQLNGPVGLLATDIIRELPAAIRLILDTNQE